MKKNLLYQIINAEDDKFSDDRDCLEWLKNQIYPQGLYCSVCNQPTKHHKVSKRQCYACDRCGSQIYPTSGTIFERSKIPLKTWFDVIKDIKKTNNVTPGEIQRKYGISDTTVRNMLQKIREHLNEKPVSNTSGETHSQTVLDDIQRNAAMAPLRKHSAREEPQLKEEDLASLSRRRDRTARLLYLQILLWHHPQGIEVKEIARKCNTNLRTTYRDLIALESELKVPIWEEGNKRGVSEGYFLPPISLTQQEAINIFVSARMMQICFPIYNPSVVSTFLKLGSIVPEPLQQHLNRTIEYMESQPRDERKLGNLNKLIAAWLTHHKVKIRYKGLKEADSEILIIEPIYIEPMPEGRSIFIVSYNDISKSFQFYKVDLIIGDVEILPETFTFSYDLETNSHFISSWDAHSSSEPETVRLLFTENDGTRLSRTFWHPSQTFEKTEDGFVIMTVKVRISPYFISWILGMQGGGSVKILEPKKLRERVLNIAKKIVDVNS